MFKFYWLPTTKLGPNEELKISSDNRPEKCSSVSSTLPWMKITWVLMTGPNYTANQSLGNLYREQRWSWACLPCLSIGNSELNKQNHGLYIDQDNYCGKRLKKKKVGESILFFCFWGRSNPPISSEYATQWMPAFQNLTLPLRAGAGKGEVKGSFLHSVSVEG